MALRKVQRVCEVCSAGFSGLRTEVYCSQVCAVQGRQVAQQAKRDRQRLDELRKLPTAPSARRLTQRQEAIQYARAVPEHLLQAVPGLPQFTEGQFVPCLLPRRHRRLRPVGFIVSPAGCWEWQAGITPFGYASVTVDRRTQLGHRAYYAHFRGRIENGLVVDHLCHNRLCVNPGHLQLLSGADNSRRVHRRKTRFTQPTSAALRSGFVRCPVPTGGRRKRRIGVGHIVEASGCWHWTGKLDSAGYGRTTFRGRHMPAHHAYYRFFRGELATGIHVHHKCGHAWCVNPDHLEPVTQQENNARRRSVKLTPDTVQRIRHLFDSGQQVSYERLARRFHVSETTIILVVQRKTWRHVPEPAA